MKAQDRGSKPLGSINNRVSAVTQQQAKHVSAIPRPTAVPRKPSRPPSAGFDKENTGNSLSIGAAINHRAQPSFAAPTANSRQRVQHKAAVSTADLKVSTFCSYSEAWFQPLVDGDCQHLSRRE